MKVQQLQPDFLYGLFQKISAKLKKDLGQLKPFYFILKDNWYDTQQALRQLTDQQYSGLKIPARLVNAIKQQLGMKVTVNTQKINEAPINNDNNHAKQPSMNEYTMVQFTNQLERDLKAQYKHDINQVQQIFQTLFKIIHNIVQDPYQMKFRTLKKANGTIQKIISNNPSVIKYLALFGFQQDAEKYFLSAPRTHELIFIEQVISQKVELLKKENFQAFLGDVKMPQKPIETSQKSSNKKYQNQNMPNLEEQFSKQKLAQMKYVDALDKLLQFRAQIMSKPPQDRKVRIYHKRHETKNVSSLVQVNMQQEFQKSQDKIIKSYWAQITKQNIKNSTFQSKRKQQFQFLIRQKVHKQTIIKVKLPNQFIIEARFGPLQKLKDVMKLCCQIIIGEIYLFHAPPVKRYDKQMQKTLFQLDSVPMGSFYLGINGQWYIQNQFSKIIQK